MVRLNGLQCRPFSPLKVSTMRIEIPLLTIACLAVCVGCNSEAGPESLDSMLDEPALGETPSIRPLEGDAATLKRLLGYYDVVVYEFRGMWLECWLECEVDGTVTSTIPRVRVSPQEFDESATFGDAQDVVGSITVHGMDQNELRLNVQAGLTRDDGTVVRPHTVPWTLTIPPSQGSIHRFGTGATLDSEWVRRIDLSSMAGEEITLQSYDWQEQEAVDGPVLRTVKVALKVAIIEPPGDTE